MRRAFESCLVILALGMLAAPARATLASATIQFEAVVLEAKGETTDSFLAAFQLGDTFGGTRTFDVLAWEPIANGVRIDLAVTGTIQDPFGNPRTQDTLELEVVYFPYAPIRIAGDAGGVMAEDTWTYAEDPQPNPRTPLEFVYLLGSNAPIHTLRLSAVDASRSVLAGVTNQVFLAIPEPASAIVLGAGIAALACGRRARKTSPSR